MDDTALHRYFAQPTQLYQRQYEALRAVVHEGKSQKDVARTFGFQYDSFRQLMHQFRCSFVAEEAPANSPFFDRSKGIMLPRARRTKPRRRFRQSRIDKPWSLPATNHCVSEPGRPASSCLFRCWPGWDSIRWSIRQAIPGAR